MLKSILKSQKWVLLSALLFTVSYNKAFFSHVIEAYPLNSNGIFVALLFVVLFCLIAIVLNLLCFRRTTKILLPILFFSGAIAAYYMDTFNVVIDKTMLINVAQTNVKEATDLFTLKMVLYVLFLGILPTVLIFKAPIPQLSLATTLKHKSILLVILLAVAIASIFSMSKSFSSFFRENKTLRFYTNPITPVYSATQFISKSSDSTPKEIAKIGEDAQISPSDTRRELIILVVGETARSDRFSINGYSRLTNPLLAQEKIVSFKNVASCGTSTAVSVPCMFSPFGRDGYTDKKFAASENLLDLLARAKVNVLWRDNNSDSKGVAIRPEHVKYEDYKEPTLNTVCDVECRDEGMLVGLQDYINQHPTGDIVIVLHQMGSHGPAYYKRYPAAFEQFKPACQNNLLEKCSVEEISNAYDNTILYTDYFLSKVIGLLKQNSNTFESAMLYMSDHGESLGENGVYLHGMPYTFAPDVQKHVPAIMWISDNFDTVTYDQLKTKENVALSHDNLFHSIIGLLEINTQDYKPSLDILKVQP